MPSANTSTVAAIVVTYNRLEKLKNVLASLEAQTRLPEHLVIVNNASTDDTAAYLAEYERDFTLKDKVRITIVTLTENAGGAGGFSAGMRKGYELGADFVWIFDDDGYPQPAALAKLLEGYDNAVAGLGTDVPYVCSMVKFIDGSISEMNNPIPTWDWGRLQAMGYDNLVMVTSCSFVSVLIPRWVMEAFGLPYKEYFIWFDDAEYTLRITQSCPGVEVTDSIVLHDMGMNQGVNYSMVNDRNVWKSPTAPATKAPIVCITGMCGSTSTSVSWCTTPCAAAASRSRCVARSTVSCSRPSRSIRGRFPAAA